ncbi:N-acetylglucosamine kinase [Rubrolithibacter danxiaensis]|uniref:N-acetylglucosamine kinase n=1 Tax=Rubrolithibacter danxiaensis TaxID=3390805 RepID=UPI003BF87BC7
MILVADSGSSKTDWILQLPDAQGLEFSTKGINPFFLGEKEITKIIHNSKEISKYALDVKEVHFFGSGCTSPDRRETVSNALSGIFKNAFIDVENDILGRAYATCGKQKGLVCILGTGSHLAFYDGEKVHQSKQGLGYILGDEGSGTYFGKKLITSFLYDTMPKELKKEFDEFYKIDKETIIKNVYQKPSPNIYLSGFARFLSKNKNHPYVQDLLYNGFEEFIATNSAIFSEYKNFPCHFVGSIAFYFQAVLTEVCKKHRISVGKVLTHPIKELYNFISEQELNRIS